jgi:two-component system response regulator YesN
MMWRVAIIDDDEKVLQGMKKNIPWNELNCQWVGEAKNGQSGIEIINDTEPDIVITDIYMPVMNGMEMIQVLRREVFKGKVIILSGYSEFEFARQALRLKIDDYLNKPASILTIKEVLTNLIKTLEDETVEKSKYVELHEKVKVYEPVVVRDWIKSVVTGNVHVTNLPEKVKNLTMEWAKKDHVVLAITYDKCLGKSKLYKEDWDLFRFATSNIIKETTVSVFEDFHYIELHSHQSVLCVHVSKDQSEKDLNRLLEELIKKIESRIKSFLGVKVFVSTGGKKKHWKHITESLNEAIPTLSRSSSYMVQQSATVEHNPELSLVSNSQQPLWSESMETNQQLSEAIRYADQTLAIKVIDQFFNKLKDQTFNKSTGVRIGIEMWTIMTYSLHDIGIRIHDMFPENFDLYTELMKNNSWEELSVCLIDRINEICEHQQWSENIKHKQLIEQMIKYVQERISENITLQDIADELYISRNYLGQIFKNVVGESFKNYLTRLRMEKAKKMIQEGNHLIYEVSEKVGYVNPAYFTTTFKKYTGFTPTEMINKKLIN